MSSSDMTFSIIAKDFASKVFGKVGKEAEGVEKKTVGMGKRAGLALAGVGTAAVMFGRKSMSTFIDTGKETLRLQRYIGGTVEDASRLKFAAQESGVGVDDLAKGLGLLSKHVFANDKAMKQLGVTTRDAHGNIRPMSELIPEIAEKFKNMPNGPDKTAKALALFGKNGMALMPFLNKGKAGISELMKESDKLGNTLSQKDVNSIKSNIVAQRQWHAAIEGVQISLARNLTPALTGAAKGLTFLTNGVEKHGRVLKPILTALAVFVGVMYTVVKVTKMYTAVQAALNVVMTMNPIGIVIVVIAALVAAIVILYTRSETARRIINTFFSSMKQGFRDVWGIVRPILYAWINVWFSVVGALINGAAKALGWVPGIGGKLRSAAREFNKFRDQVNGALNGVRDKHVRVTVDAVVLKAGPYAGKVLPLARGGRFRAGQKILVGEEGPELMTMEKGGYVTNHKETQRMLRSSSGGGGAGYASDGNLGTVVVNLTLDGKVIQKSLLKLKRLNGGLSLGLA